MFIGFIRNLLNINYLLNDIIRLICFGSNFAYEKDPFEVEKQDFTCFAMAINSDNNLLVVGVCCNIKVIEITNNSTFKELQLLKQHQQPVLCLNFFTKNSSTRSFISVADTIIIYFETNFKWDNYTSLRIEQDISQVKSLVIHPQEDLFICGSQKTIQFWFQNLQSIHFSDFLFFEHYPQTATLSITYFLNFKKNKFLQLIDYVYSLIKYFKFDIIQISIIFIFDSDNFTNISPPLLLFFNLYYFFTYNLIIKQKLNALKVYKLQIEQDLIYGVNVKKQWQYEFVKKKSQSEVTIDKEPDDYIQDDQSVWTCKMVDNVDTFGLSINQQGDRLISCSREVEILVMKGSNTTEWSKLYTIKVNSYGLRLCFITNDVFAFQERGSRPHDQLRLYSLSLRQQLNQSGFNVKGGNQSCNSLFPLSYVPSKQLIIDRNGDHVNVVSIKQDKFQGFEAKLVQDFQYKTEYIYGTVSQDGNLLILWDEIKKEIQLRRFNACY